MVARFECSLVWGYVVTDVLVIDPRTAPDPFAIPNVALVPLSAAHIVIAKARATVYRWVEEDRITVHLLNLPGKAVKQYVQAGELRELEARMHLLGLSEKRRTKVLAARETMR